GHPAAGQGQGHPAAGQGQGEGQERQGQGQVIRSADTRILSGILLTARPGIRSSLRYPDLWESGNPRFQQSHGKDGCTVNELIAFCFSVVMVPGLTIGCGDRKEKDKNKDKGKGTTPPAADKDKDKDKDKKPAAS